MTQPVRPKFYPYSFATEQVTLIQRYKRFLADVRRGDGEELTVHCPNSGSMKTCWEPNDPARISDSGNEKRKLRFTIEQVCRDGAWVGVNTAIPNRAVEHLVRSGAIPELAGLGGCFPEVKYGEGLRSRIDLLLRDSDQRPAPGEILPGDVFVEVKNTTMRDGDHAAFPDAVTERGRKHLMELADVVSAGGRAVMVAFIGREDCERFRPCDEIDPEYGKAMRKAVKRGVEVLALRFRYWADGVELIGNAPVDL